MFSGRAAWRVKRVQSRVGVSLKAPVRSMVGGALQAYLPCQPVPLYGVGMTLPESADYGAFAIQTSLNDDLKVIRSSIELARVNPSKPGHHWHRIVARVTNQVPQLEIIKMFHVDCNAGVVEITETHDGKETARRTLPLDAMG